jgi:methyltransferase-like protein
MEIEIKLDSEQLIDKGVISEIVANRIVSMRTNANWNELDSAILDGIKDAATSIVEDYIKNYYGQAQIENLVKELMRKMTKDDIINILK